MMLTLPLPPSMNDHDRALAMFRALCPDSDSIRVLMVGGNPKSKARARFTRKGGGVAYSSRAQRDAENALAWRFRAAFKEPMHGNIAVGCIFYRKTRQRIDADNMLKHVMDSANKIVWDDDCQVTAQLGIVELDPDNPRTVIMIGEHTTTMKRANDTPQKCERCQKVFKKPFRKSRYCSRSCAGFGSQGTRLAKATCPTCREVFQRKAARQRYCSNPCKHGARRGGGTKNNPPTCEQCGARVSRREYRRCMACYRGNPRAEISVVALNDNTEV